MRILDAIGFWLIRMLRIGPRCHQCKRRIVHPEPAMLVPCFGGHMHFAHHRCLVREAQRILDAAEAKRGPRA
jgi:hypothetical protein